MPWKSPRTHASVRNPSYTHCVTKLAWMESVMVSYHIPPETATYLLPPSHSAWLLVFWTARGVLPAMQLLLHWDCMSRIYPENKKTMVAVGNLFDISKQAKKDEWSGGWVGETLLEAILSHGQPFLPLSRGIPRITGKHTQGSMRLCASQKQQTASVWKWSQSQGRWLSESSACCASLGISQHQHQRLAWQQVSVGGRAKQISWDGRVHVCSTNTPCTYAHTLTF